MEEQTTIQLKLNLGITDDQILDKIKLIKEKQAKVALINKEINELKEQIKDEMIRRNLEKLTIDIFKINYISVKSTKFNTNKFKKEHSDMYNSYCYKSESKRFEIT